MNKLILSVTVAAGVLLAAGDTPSHAVLANGCSVAKERATTKNFSCRLREHGKVLRGKDADFNRCDEKLVAAFTKAEAAGGCPSTGDSATAILLAANAASGVFDDLNASSAAEDQIPCVLSKARATTVYAKCQSTALAKRLADLYLGLKLDFGACEDALDAAFVAAEDAGPCATTGDSGVVGNSAGGGYGFLPNVNWHSNVYPNFAYATHAALPNAYMVGNDFFLGQFGDANLSGANLTGSNLSTSRWIGADLSGADLSGVNFSHVTLILGTDVSDATLGTADLTDLRASDVVGCPATLPVAWQCREHLLIGPTARLDNGNFAAFDLSGTDLTDGSSYGTNFSGANLAGMFLAGADVRYSDFTGADLSSATLVDAFARHAKFIGADLSNAAGTNADCQEATFDGANVTGSDFSNADLSLVHATNLIGCPSALPTDWDCRSGVLVGPLAGLFSTDLSGVDFSGLNLDTIVLTSSNLTGAIFDGTNLSSAKLDGADFTNVDLSTATLTGVSANALVACPAALPPGWACIANTLVGPGADMRYRDFTGASFDGLDLTGASFYDCDLSDATFAGANLTNVHWYYSICPDHQPYSYYDSCCNHLNDVPASCGP